MKRDYWGWIGFSLVCVCVFVLTHFDDFPHRPDLKPPEQPPILTVKEKECRDSKLADSCYQAAQMYLKAATADGGYDSSAAIAFELLGSACELRDGRACREHALWACNGGRSGDLRFCLAELKNACDWRDTDGCWWLATAHLQGLFGVEINGRLAVNYYGRACDFGNADACNEAGRMYVVEDSGAGGADPRAAKPYFDDGCRLGDVRSCRDAAKMTECFGDEKSDQEAFEALKSLCGNGDRGSCDELAVYLRSRAYLRSVPMTGPHQAAWLRVVTELARSGGWGEAKVYLDVVDPDSPKRRFISAAHAVDVGDYPAAKKILDELKKGPDGTDVAVAMLSAATDALAAHQSDALSAMTRAWMAAGRPDLRKSSWPVVAAEYDGASCKKRLKTLMPIDLQLPPPTGHAISIIARPHLLDVLDMNETLSESDEPFRAKLKGLKDPRPEVRTAAAISLSTFIEPAHRDEVARAEVLRARDSMKSHDSVWATMALASVLLRPNSLPLDDDEISLLDEAVDLYEPQAQRQAIGKLLSDEWKDQTKDGKLPKWAVLRTAIALSRTPGTRTLLDRCRHKAEKASHDQRVKMGSILDRLARRTIASGTVSDLYRAEWLTRTGADISGSDATADLESAVTNRYDALHDGATLLPWFGQFPMTRVEDDIAQWEFDGRLTELEQLTMGGTKAELGHQFDAGQR